jgi:hypothetical protein
MIHLPFPLLNSKCAYADDTDMTYVSLGSLSSLRFFLRSKNDQYLKYPKNYPIYGLGTTWSFIFLTESILEPFL